MKVCSCLAEEAVEYCLLPLVIAHSGVLHPTQESDVEVPGVWMWVPNHVLPLRNPSRGFTKEVMSRGMRVPGTKSGWATSNTILPGFVQCLCNQTHWGKHRLAQALGPAMCQRICAEWRLGQGIPQGAMGGFMGSK